MSERITAEELMALGKVCRDLGIVDFASGDTRFVINPSAHVRGTVMAPLPDDTVLNPIVRQGDSADEDEDERLLMASVT